MAITPWPIRRLSESPSVAIRIASRVCCESSSSGTVMIAMSEAARVPRTVASAVLSSTNCTLRLWLSATTWLLVTIKSSFSFCPIMIPEPLLSVGISVVSCCQKLPKPPRPPCEV